MLFTRGEFSMEPDQAPPMVTEVDGIVMRCPIFSLGDETGQQVSCDMPIEMYANFRPGAYICPWCFSIFIIDHSSNAIHHSAADFQFECAPNTTTYCYSTDQNHAAQSHLHSDIDRVTGGHGLLLAHAMNPTSFGDTELVLGRMLHGPTLATEQDLRSMLVDQRQIAEEILLKAWNHYTDRENSMALALAQRAIVVDPTFDMSHRLAGDALDELGYPDEAIPYYNQAITLNPQDEQVRNNLAYALYRVGDWDNAVRHYQEAIRLNPAYAEARGGLASVYLEQGKAEAALRELQIALRQRPDHVVWIYNLGFAYMQMRKLQDALARFRQAAQLAPDYADAHHACGEVLGQLGRLDEAVREWKVAAALGSLEARERLASLRRY